MHIYHPYRFGEYARASTRRVERVLSEAGKIDPSLGTTAQAAKNRLMSEEAPGMSDNEFAARLANQDSVNAMRTVWATNGQLVFDMSALLAPLAQATSLELPRFPKGLPDAFYIHFGPAAGLDLTDAENSFIDGMYVVRRALGQEAFDYALVCGTHEDLDAADMTWGQILRLQSQIVVGTAPDAVSFGETARDLVGDPFLRADGIVPQALDRAMLALSHIDQPEYLADMDQASTAEVPLKPRPMH